MMTLLHQADEWIMSRELSLFSVAVRKHCPGAAWGGKYLFQLTVQGKNSKEPGGKRNQVFLPCFYGLKEKHQ